MWAVLFGKIGRDIILIGRHYLQHHERKIPAMREIKFRQYHNGKFYYWGLGIKGSTFISPTNVDLMTIDNPHQQYTGLTDKNGVEIYEGDIFKTVMGWVAVVEWDEINARFLGFTLERERKILYVG